jgi:hypothetical protein
MPQMNQAEINRLAPNMFHTLPLIRQVFSHHAPKTFVLEFTGGKEWFGHGIFSLHHSGNALDIRTRTLPDRGVGAQSKYIAVTLQKKLDSCYGAGKYTVLHNDQGPSKPHIHVQYNKGERWSTPGNYDGGKNVRNLA